MNLSEDLLSQFAKATNDNPKEKADTTCYGTAVESEGIMYVQLDGSELYTPMITTVGIENGDRVMVMLKNHRAIVTGNLSSPASRNDSVAAELINITNRVAAELINITNRVASVESDNSELKEKVENINGVTKEEVQAIDNRVTTNETDIKALRKDIDSMKSIEFLLNVETGELEYVGYPLDIEFSINVETGELMVNL